MKDKLLLVIVLTCILGSVLVSSLEFLSYTFKAIFYAISMTVLLIIGNVVLFKYFRRGNEGSI
ncbi:hypothetical protein J2S74_000914 [Evansella vedderi]|uniref:Uncharacterized protein n=1 Tax=Evansella vedderi TaxID=38282 RepID=A0ABT9ZS11_9BACI|nr:hypothetical protein [Evansella vedderi]MDQ0253542.1 hypothetical protein [Evansella vedderi]